VSAALLLKGEQSQNSGTFFLGGVERAGKRERTIVRAVTDPAAKRSACGRRDKLKSEQSFAPSTPVQQKAANNHSLSPGRQQRHEQKDPDR